MISLTHALIFKPTRKKWWLGQKVDGDIDRTPSTGVLEGWVTAYLFGMMKIFPSRQPFVVLVPRTACQICFSSPPSCLHGAAITHTHTQCMFPHRPQQVCDSGYVRFYKMKESSAFLAHHYRRITSGLNYLSQIHTHTHRVNALHTPFFSFTMSPRVYPVAKHDVSRRREGGWFLWSKQVGRRCRNLAKKLMQFVKQHTSFNCVIAGNRAEAIMSRWAIKQMLRGNNIAEP